MIVNVIIASLKAFQNEQKQLTIEDSLILDFIDMTQDPKTHNYKSQDFKQQITYLEFGD